MKKIRMALILNLVLKKLRMEKHSRKLLDIRQVGQSPHAPGYVIFHPTLVSNNIKNSQMYKVNIELYIFMTPSTNTESDKFKSLIYNNIL